MKLQLPNVTLFCLDCEEPHRAIRVLEHCKNLCDFGSVQFLTSQAIEYPHVTIEQIGTGHRGEGLIAYSDWMLKNLHSFTPTSHVLVVQHDGWILNPSSWDSMWLNYDYMGPLFIQYPYVGSGGFSLRSKKLMQQVSQNLQPYCFETGYGRTGYIYEDGVIAFGMRKQLETHGCRFAPADVAARFAYGGNKSHYCSTPFGFHGFYALDTLLGGTGDPLPRNPNLASRTP